MWKNEMAMDKIESPDQAVRFLKGLGLQVKVNIVLDVVAALRDGVPMYRLWNHGRHKSPICGKGTAYKIKKLYEDGRLNPYLDYSHLDQTMPPLNENNPDVPCPALLSLCACAYQSSLTGKLRPYSQKPLLWVDVLVTNNSPTTLHDVEIWVTDVAREAEWDTGTDERNCRGEPWSAIPLAWPTGEVRISIPPGGTRMTRLVSCDDDNGWTLLLKGATGAPHRLVGGALRVGMEVFSPDEANAKKVLSVRVTPRSVYREELELHEDEDPGVKNAYRRCKEILNEPGLPWHPIIDLRNVPRRAVFAQVESKARAPYEKVADSFIAADRELDSLPVRRESKRRREAVIDPRIKPLEVLRSELGEDLWPTLLGYFPIHERPAQIEVES